MPGSLFLMYKYSAICLKKPIVFLFTKLGIFGGTTETGRHRRNTVFCHEAAKTQRSTKKARKRIVKKSHKWLIHICHYPRAIATLFYTKTEPLFIRKIAASLLLCVRCVKSFPPPREILREATKPTLLPSSSVYRCLQILFCVVCISCRWSF